MSSHKGDPIKHGLLATLSLFDSPSKPDRMCTYCAKLQIQVIAEEKDPLVLVADPASRHILHQEYEDLFPTLPWMEYRATNGCTFCKFIRSSVLGEYHRLGLTLSGKARAGRIVLKANFIETFKDEIQTSLSIYRKGTPLVPHPLIIHVALPGTGTPTEHRQISFKIAIQISAEPGVTSHNPLSRENMDHCKRWIEACQLNHSTCRSNLGHYTPTRVLEVKNDILRLVTKGTEARKYAALSYCWGPIPKDKKSFLTTRGNLALRLSGFLLDELPLTLQDAIRTSRALDIDYIWIDALCIVQDDVDEWADESSRMNQIYGNATVTIAATTSKSSFDGFLQEREPAYKLSSNFVFKEVQSFHSDASMQELGVMHFRYPPETSVAKHLAACHWETRGWTLQERLLSTRILYFTKDIIYFECATSQELENPSYELPERPGLSMLLAESRVIPAAERLSKREIYLSRWYEVVAMYTSRKITAAADKLPAMDGLAASVKDVINDTYVYGLWRSDLHRGLLWHSWYKVPWKRPRGGYRAPTWSWACRDGPIVWDRFTYEPGWESLIQVTAITPHSKCSCCQKTQGAQLELIAGVAPLKDVLQAYLDEGEEECDVDDWDTLESWDGFDELGTFELDDSSEEELYLPDTRMMLVAERAAPRNLQALLIQPYRDTNKFQRVGWFIQEDSLFFNEYNKEDPNVTHFREDFEPMRKLFKNERLTLV